MQELTELLQGPLVGLFGGVHLLPFFHPIDGADAGFDPIDHTMIDPRLGTWDDLQTVGSLVEVMADLIVNHVSSLSPQFQDLSRRGDSSPYSGMFLAFDKVFPEGALEADLLKIYRPRPGLPFHTSNLSNGEKRLLWTTFTPQQIDIDVRHPKGVEYLDTILARFHAAGVRAIRMDAVGYAIKKRGTSCFMIRETFDFIETLSRQAHSLGIEVLVEVHSYYEQQIEIAKRVDWVYDFALPPLVLYALLEADARPLFQWLSIRPKNSVTVLDTHDGIGVIDVGADSGGRPGLLEPAAIDKLVDSIHRLSNDESRKATGSAANNLDLYQVNCTYFDALGRDETRYLIARAVQFFVPGIPQVYYVGLLGGPNDMELLAKTGVGRDINRHHYTAAEVLSALERSMVQHLLELIRLRNAHPAFNGICTVESPHQDLLNITWTLGPHRISLNVDFSGPSATIEYTAAQSELRTLHIGASHDS